MSLLSIHLYKLLKSTPQWGLVAAFENNREILVVLVTNTSSLLPVIGLYHISISCEVFSECHSVRYFSHSFGLLVLYSAVYDSVIIIYKMILRGAVYIITYLLHDLDKDSFPNTWGTQEKKVICQILYIVLRGKWFSRAVAAEWTWMYMRAMVGGEFLIYLNSIFELQKVLVVSICSFKVV